MVNEEDILNSQSNEGSSETTDNKENEKDNQIPESLQDSSIKKTKVTTLKKVIEDKLRALKDLATLEVFMETNTRMRERLKSINSLSSATHYKIRGHFKTTAPQMHIAKLKGTKINNDEAEITFSVYESDKEGNKKVYNHSTEIVKEDGSKINRVTSSEYRIQYEVVEKIKTGKAIEREIIKLDLVKNG